MSNTNIHGVLVERERMVRVRRRGRPEVVVSKYKIADLVEILEETYTIGVKMLASGVWSHNSVPQIIVPKGTEALFVGREYGTYRDFLVVDALVGAEMRQVLVHYRNVCLK